MKLHIKELQGIIKKKQINNKMIYEHNFMYHSALNSAAIEWNIHSARALRN